MNEIDGWLPPMQAMRAFVAAVRTGSFARACEELGLTHGAVSHHVAQIEHLAGAKLFERHRRGVTPTPEAVRLAERLGRSLTEMTSALAELRDGGRSALTVTMTAAFAQRWLLPRFEKFQSKHPEIDLRILPIAALLNLETSGIDLAVRCGPGGWKGVDARLLAREMVFPVASPLYRKGRLPKAPAELAGCTLIRSPRQPWAPWFRAAGLAGMGKPGSGPTIDDSSLALDLAARGQGIALARGILASAELAAGRLVKLFPIEIEDAFAYHLVRRPGGTKRQARQAFEAWTESEMAA